MYNTKKIILNNTIDALTNQCGAKDFYLKTKRNITDLFT